jgi:hypothetical protein
MNGYGNGGTGTLTARDMSAQPTPSGNANGALQFSRKLTEQLHQAIAALEQRLSPILQDEPPTATGTGNAANVRSVSSSFVGAISDTNTALETALARLQNIASRIDL